MSKLQSKPNVPVRLPYMLVAVILIAALLEFLFPLTGGLAITGLALFTAKGSTGLANFPTDRIKTYGLKGECNDRTV